MMKVLFVCLGNICRSPAAEGVARCLADSWPQALCIDSAGTGGWHIGEAPHAVMRKVAREYGFPIDDLRARQVSQQDFEDFDWILAMDRQNLADLEELRRGCSGAARLGLLLEHADLGLLDVPDPYYGGEEGFHRSFSLIRKGVEGFFAKNVHT